jgi:4-hydroxy-4-methyl-2-oxoglutarate aldolase
LDAIGRVATPTISNAIETLRVRPRNTGYMSPEIRSIFPELGVMVGYASTATFSADLPAPESRQISIADYWQSVLRIPEPRVVVIQDLDNPPCIGSFLGEVQANIHKALGCVGIVTNGGVRDLDPVRALHFHCFAASLVVSHAYAHLVDFGLPVRVGGLVVNPGDLIHADKHGVIAVPREVARHVAQAASEYERVESKFIDFCRSPDFSVEKLKAMYLDFRKELSEISSDVHKKEH